MPTSSTGSLGWRMPWISPPRRKAPAKRRWGGGDSQEDADDEGEGFKPEGVDMEGGWRAELGEGWEWELVGDPSTRSHSRNSGRICLCGRAFAAKASNFLRHGRFLMS